MTNDELDRLTEKIYCQVKNIPGLDKIFIRKCLTGINSLHDPQVDEKIRILSKFI